MQENEEQGPTLPQAPLPNKIVPALTTQGKKINGLLGQTKNCLKAILPCHFH